MSHQLFLLTPQRPKEMMLDHWNDPQSIFLRKVKYYQISLLLLLNSYLKSSVQLRYLEKLAQFPRSVHFKFCENRFFLVILEKIRAIFLNQSVS